ncbi:MAG: hypothetical protein Q9221_001513 [Calogaya cf. arnoldii]
MSKIRWDYPFIAPRRPLIRKHSEIKYFRASYDSATAGATPIDAPQTSRPHSFNNQKRPHFLTVSRYPKKPPSELMRFKQTMTDWESEELECVYYFLQDEYERHRREVRLSSNCGTGTALIKEQSPPIRRLLLLMGYKSLAIAPESLEACERHNTLNSRVFQYRLIDMHHVRTVWPDAPPEIHTANHGFRDFYENTVRWLGPIDDYYYAEAPSPECGNPDRGPVECFLRQLGGCGGIEIVVGFVDRTTKDTETSPNRMHHHPNLMHHRPTAATVIAGPWYVSFGGDAACGIPNVYRNGAYHPRRFQPGNSTGKSRPAETIVGRDGKVELNVDHADAKDWVKAGAVWCDDHKDEPTDTTVNIDAFAPKSVYPPEFLQIINAAGPQSPQAPHTPVEGEKDENKCHGVNGEFWVIHRDTAVKNVEDFGAQDSKSLEYDHDSVDHLGLSVELSSDDKKGPKDIPNCRDQFVNVVIDACDGDDAPNNPHN